MRKPRRRRIRSPHPGIKLVLRRDGTWHGRWRDPLSGKVRQESLTALGLTNEETRRDWCIKKSVALHKTAAAVASGSAIAERTTMAKAIERYCKAATTKASTMLGYTPALKRLQDWCSDAGIKESQDLQPRHLTAYRDFVVKLPVATAQRGGKRGAKVAGRQLRSPAAVNKTLTVCKLFLTWARRSGLVPHLDGDAVRDRLKPVRVDRAAVDFLRPAELQKLLEAALRHDAATFDLTREEHDGLRPKGTTTRYEPCSAFVLLSVLLGMRLQELVWLQWSEVDLQAGEIRLPAARTKTAAARTVTLQETPAALQLLQAMRLRVGGDRVFPQWTGDLAKAVRKRLVADFAAAPFSWQMLRRSTAAILTNSPGIYSGASAYRSARRAGHSVVVAERFYVDLLRDLPADARTLEAAAGIEKIALEIVASVGNAAMPHVVAVTA